MSDIREVRLLLELVGDARAPVELPRQGVLTIGSADKADLVLAGQGVADVHCAIGRVKGGGWALKDLGSEYGVVVNGEKVQTRKLEAGDLLLVGSRRLKVIDEAALAQRAPAAPRPAETVAPAPPKPAEQGASRLLQVRGYRVEKQLGRGGMGEVYLAVQESLGRPVALKVLAAKLAADTDFVKRFQSEARAAAALNHPNVVTVHDVWEDGGRHFLAMEFMDRGNLEQRLAREGKLPPKECLDVLHDAAKALVYAELRGIVHRDIKPANLMQNSVGTTKVADLGLAMHLEAEATESDNKKIYGTPHFISPEQARGEKVDIRSDLYSLGATLYRLLSGRTPFEGATTRDILRGHFLDEPRPLTELVPGIPPDLAKAVHRMLQKKPDERFPSAGVLLQEVERMRSAALHGAPVVVHAPRKSKLGPWIAVAVVALAVAVAVRFILLKEPPAPDPRASGPTPAGTRPPADTGEEPTPGVPAPPDRPVDDDTRLKLRETEAENAELKLARDLTPQERAEALMALSERFAGTTAAERFKEQAEQLRVEILRAQSVSDSHAQDVRVYLERLRQAGREGEQPKALSEALRAMLAEPTPEVLAADPAVMQKRTALFAEAVHTALERGREALGQADEAAQRGEFEQLDALLRPWIAALDLPPMPQTLGYETLPELGDVDALRLAIRRRVDGLDAERMSYAQKLGDDDALALAHVLRGPDGFEGALRRLDFEALDQRLASLEGGLSLEDSRRFVAELRGGFAAARKALANLAAEYDRGGWRRKSVNDPRTRTRTTRDAVGATAEGLLLRVDDAQQLVPWSAFGGRTLDLHQLFHQRLAREYTAEELAGIDTLVRATAVLQAVDETAEMLQASSSAMLSDDEVRSVVDAFEVARTWSAAAGATARLERENEAAALLVSALRASKAGTWSRSVADLERLLAEFRSTLLVRLLSDGRPVTR